MSDTESPKIDEHLLTVKEVAEKYGTHIDVNDIPKSKGLSEDQVKDYLDKYGPNKISPPPKPHPIREYLKYLCGLFNLLLILSGILSFILYGVDSSDSSTLVLGGVLIFVAMLNAFLDFIQAHRTASLLASFTTMIPANAEVIRDGKRTIIDATLIIPGDLVYIKMGDKVPADMRLIIAKEVKVDNSSLTGESEPQERSLESGHENPMEASNIVFNGTLVVSGEGAGIVIRIGDKTVLGQIANLTLHGKKRESQLTLEIERFVKLLATIALLTTIVFFFIGVARGYTIATNFTFAIGVFVSFVPEGLPLTVSILLTIAAKRLAKKNVLVKDLHGVETLGSITMLCTDKTGTLTQNRMTTSSLWINLETYDLDPKVGQTSITFDATESGWKIAGDNVSNYKLLVECFSLCNRIKISDDEWNNPCDERVLLGDATEQGLFRYVMARIDVRTLQREFPKIFEIPFSSETKWHLTIHKYPHTNGHYLMFLKGAPERVLFRCSAIRVGEELLSIDENIRNQFDRAYEKFAGLGQRVLGFAYQFLNSDAFPLDFIFSENGKLNFSVDDFIFLSLASLIDPPKAGVKRSVCALKSASIQVVMVTGDHPLTAKAIARQIHLIEGETVDEAAARLLLPLDSVPESEYDSIVVHGDSIDNLQPPDWDHIFSKKEIVFARTSPKQKLEIVSRAQDKGHIVGVSGDGVNDAPALKKADLGISMNKTGSDVSKEAAAMILLDDDFTSIVIGIEQGRLLFANLKKSIRYTLTHIMPEILAFLFYIILAIPLPITSLLILVVDLASELSPSLSYAWERPEKNLMLVPPRKVLVMQGKTILQHEQETSLSNIRRTLTLELTNSIIPPPLSLTRTVTNTEFVIDASLDRRSAAQAPLPRSTFFLPSSFRKLYHKLPIKDDLKVKKMENLPVYGPQPLSFKMRVHIWYNQAIAWFKKQYLSHETGEALVDKQLLIWCYFQGGIFLTIGCFGAYLYQLFLENVPFSILYEASFTYFKNASPGFLLTDGMWANANTQASILASAQSAYFAGIIIGQWFTLFIVKHRYEYPYGWDLFKNWRSLVSMVISAGIGALVLYIPFFNTILSSGPVGILPLLMPVAAGCFYLLYEFIRRFLHFKGYLGGVPAQNLDLLEVVRTTTIA